MHRLRMLITPLISTLLLVIFGRAEASVGLALACLHIVGGAFLAAKDIVRLRARSV